MKGGMHSHMLIASVPIEAEFDLRADFGEGGVGLRDMKDAVAVFLSIDDGEG